MNSPYSEPLNRERMIHNAQNKEQAGIFWPPRYSAGARNKTLDFYQTKPSDSKYSADD